MNEQMRALLEFLDKSQWNSFHDIQQKQLKHAELLIQHARHSVPFYQQFYAPYQGITAITDLPVLTRSLIQSAGNDFISQQLPDFHGSTYPMETSGSTGKPVKVLATDFTRLFYDALMLREHAWHQRDYSKKLLSIRWTRRGVAEPPLGHQQPTWGPPINQYHTTGPSIFINVASETQKQIDALLLHSPHYLLSYPSQLAALAEYCIDKQIHMPFLEEVRTTGESLQDNYIHMIKQAWPQAILSDVYSSVEIGNIAQQCAEYQHYHVNQEHTLLEIVDDHSQPCKAGQPGRVLLTSLLNYATPLIRYEIGDYAEWGEPCPCGRGLAVIKKIHGRKRNRLILPTGESLFPYLGEREDRNKITTAVRKFQFIQHTTQDIEYKIVVSEPLTHEQENQLRHLHQKNLGYPFNIIITYVDHIPPHPTGKYEEFISLVNNTAIS